MPKITLNVERSTLHKQPDVKHVWKESTFNAHLIFELLLKIQKYSKWEKLKLFQIPKY